LHHPREAALLKQRSGEWSSRSPVVRLFAQAAGITWIGLIAGLDLVYVSSPCR
jgi:hypothetical protein